MTSTLEVPRRTTLFIDGSASNRARIAAAVDGPVFGRGLVFRDYQGRHQEYETALADIVGALDELWSAPDGPSLVGVVDDGLVPGHIRHLMRQHRKAGGAVRHVAADEVSSVMVREPLPLAHMSMTGSFDIVGDIHGCADEFRDLLGKLGYKIQDGIIQTTADRVLVCVGDLVDRGPASLDVLNLVSASVEAGTALCVMGNHDRHLLSFLSGQRASRTHGSDVTQDAVAALDDGRQEALRCFLERLPGHLLLDAGRLVVTHAGIEPWMIGRESDLIDEYNYFGLKTGLFDDAGKPVRGDWQSKYGDGPMVVYGHEAHLSPKSVGRTLCIDTRCYETGQLTALRWPELELVMTPPMPGDTPRP